MKIADVHQTFNTYLSTLTISSGKAALCLKIFQKQFGDNKTIRTKKILKLQEELERLKKIIDQAEDNLFEGKIDSITFERGKAKYTQRITDLEFDISELKSTGSRFMKKVKEALEVFKSLKTLYNSGAWETKQMILGSIFAEKLVFEKS